MKKIRVMIVDDSVVIRRMLSDIITEDPRIEVAATAANGRIALNKIEQVKPDLITLDVEMPELDGLQTLPLLREKYPKLPVIMFSTLTARGAAATFDALERGATDYCAKPANVGSVSAGMESVRSVLIPKIKALCTVAPTPFRSLKTKAENAGTQNLRNLGKEIQRQQVAPSILAIGSSTGGPQALATVLKKLPASFPLPILIVQHMPPVFTGHLAQRLNAECAIQVCEAEDGMPVRSGHALIAPGDFHMEVKRNGTANCVVIHQGQPENSCRPAVDVLFRSVAQIAGARALGVVLTGMGQDGLQGAQAIDATHGRMIVQDEQSCVVWGMPRAIAEAGLADKILSLNSIADELMIRVATRQEISAR